ncbi:ATP-binding protein [Aequorivita nionensis]|uniref:ATP-binding protein n=1 Tax=Aequorivita nionensis TaxID=1287690 RepID=UPI003965B683
MEKLKFYLSNRFILFIFLSCLLVIVNYLFTGFFLPNTETKDIWFYSGLFMVLFSILFIEPFYSSPKNVITNAIPLILVFISIKTSFKNLTLWWCFLCSLVLLIILSIGAMALSQEDESQESTRNKIAHKLKAIAVIAGQGKVIYSAVFLAILFSYKSELIETVSDTYFFTLIILWGLILLINTKKIHNNFIFQETATSTTSIGEIFSVQSNKMFLIKLFENKKNLENFDLVKFRYQMDKGINTVNEGFIFDTYNLNRTKWAKVYTLNQKTEEKSKLKLNTVYHITEQNEIDQLNEQLKIEGFIGVIIEGSKIGNIKFEYSKKRNDLQEGDLLELYVGETKVYYQVIGGYTNSEKLEFKDESGFIEGEAMQLGVWNNETISFEKFGWVPAMNTSIFIADTEDIEIKDFELPEYKLGVIPKTNLPSVINLDDAVSHHIALLGVTGAGKSFLAMEIIKELLNNTKVICIDFTGEWKKMLADLNPVSIIDAEGLPVVETQIAKKENLASTKNPDKTELIKLRDSIQKKLEDYVSKYIDSQDNLALFEIPELSNTTFILEFTQYFIEAIFKYAKSHPGQKICLVLEEAHTIVPETNFLGDLGDYGSSKALVSKMSQIALQGRKYGVGLMVIAQRTANVSKTVLTQCNTIICFQAFDETSFTFLGNYIGKDLVQTLPNLKKYHAVVTGKAVKTNIPMIVNLKREIPEPPEE